MVTATPHEDVEAAYGADREAQLLLDIMLDAALCCRERHAYMPSSEEDRRSFQPHLWVLEGANEYANHAYAEGRKDANALAIELAKALRDLHDAVRGWPGPDGPSVADAQTKAAALLELIDDTNES